MLPLCMLPDEAPLPEELLEWHKRHESLRAATRAFSMPWRKLCNREREQEGMVTRGGEGVHIIWQYGLTCSSMFTASPVQSARVGLPVFS